MTGEEKRAWGNSEQGDQIGRLFTN
jgi:hypothetical protein